MKRTAYRTFGLLVIAVFFAPMAHAKVLFNPAFTKTYYEEVNNNTNTTIESESTVLGGTVSFAMENGVHFGGTVFRSEDKDGNKDTGYGPTVGLFKEGFFVAGTYVMSYESESGSTTYKGSGIEVDIGYLASVTDRFYIGPQIKYFSLNFDESETSGTTVDQDIDVTTYEPYVGFVYTY